MRDSMIAQLIDAKSEAGKLRAKLAQCERELAELEPQVEQVIAEAANRLLVDAAGQPIDSGVYWWSKQALVRVNGTVRIIPMETMDEAKIFLFEPETEPEAEEKEVLPL